MVTLPVPAVLETALLAEAVADEPLLPVGLSSMFGLLVTLNSDVLVEGGTKPAFNEINIGSASLPANHSSAVVAGTSPSVSGYKSSWKSSDCAST